MLDDVDERPQQSAADRGHYRTGPPQYSGPYHPSEVCVHAFDKWFVETLGTRLTELAG